MDDAKRARLLDEAVTLSRKMLERAAQNEWTEVVELEARRRGCLERAFATRAPLTEPLAERVREILRLNEALLDAGSRERDRIGDELAGIGRGRRGTRAYRATA